MTPTFTFNPPTASAMPDSTDFEPQRSPYELRRVMMRYNQPRLRNIRRVGNQGKYNEPHYYYACKRTRCFEEIECYRVVTGTHEVPQATFGLDTPLTRTVEDAVYYWPDTAIVVETGTDYSRRTVQAGFCSMKCLSLWAAKIARDTE